MRFLFRSLAVLLIVACGDGSGDADEQRLTMTRRQVVGAGLVRPT